MPKLQNWDRWTKSDWYERRGGDQLREHYEIERALATKLREAPPESRKQLYAEVYDELIRRVAHHGIFDREHTDPEFAAYLVRRSMRFLRPFLRPSTIYVEVGAGACTLSREVAGLVERAYPLEVSAAAAEKAGPFPPNCELVLFNGTTIPLPDESADVVFSNQVMEHVHPDDAYAQLREIYRILRPGGLFLCITPNALSGPHDISMYFDEVPTGFHLKEYTVSELYALLRCIGFSRVQKYVGIQVRYVAVPLLPLVLLEKTLAWMPFRIRARVARWAPIRLLLGVRMVASKGRTADGRRTG